MRNLFRATSKYLDAKHRIVPLSCSQNSIEAWFNTDYGQYLLRHEQQDLMRVMPDSGAHRMMHLGVTSQQLLLGDFNHLHSFSVGSSVKNPGNSTAITDFDALPLPSETVDTVLLHHALEFSVFPHEVLKEASRVLKPCGHMALVVLNPSSLFGLTKWPARLFSSNAIWRHHSLRYGRILDWLRLLNIQPISVVAGCFGWPEKYTGEQRTEGVMDRFGQKHRLPFGAYYVVVARKYVTRPTFSGSRKWKSIHIPVVPAVKKDSVINTPLRGKHCVQQNLSEKNCQEKNS